MKDKNHRIIMYLYPVILKHRNYEYVSNTN
jgi:hypothetical protein